MHIFIQMMLGITVGVLGYLMLRPIANAPHSSSQRISENAPHSSSQRGTEDFFDTPGSTCPICQDEMENRDMRYLPCRHALHDTCYLSCVRNGHKKCPICRTDF